MAVLTGVFVVVTMFSVIFGYCQVNVSRDAVEIARKALQFQRQTDSINAVSSEKEDSLNNARQDKRDSISNARASENFKVENRAYLVLMVDSKTLETDTSLHVTWHVRNVGKTPAYKERTTVLFGFSELTDSELAKIPLPMTSAVIGSGIDDIRPAVFSYPKSRPQTVWMAINVGYEDIFRRSHYSHGYVKITKDLIITMSNYNDAD